MGNTHIEEATKENLLAYNKENGHRSVSRGIDALLAEHVLLIVTQRECELLEQILAPYELDEEDVVL